MCFNCDRCINLVCLQKLIYGKFTALSLNDKLKVIKKGRCVPNLQIIQTKGNVTRQFQVKYYKSFSWLTGCVHTDRLFCFPCILFGNSPHIWNDTGYVDLRNFHTAARKHDQSEKHLEACIKLATFSRANIQTSLNSQSRFDIERHNAKVERNRHIFRRLIDIVCFLGKQELAFCQHDESVSSLNKGNYLELINLLAKYDGVLETYLGNLTSASSDLSNIAHDLIWSVASLLKKTIKQQIKESDFVTFIVDETPDVSGREQLVLILRYVHNAQVVDRFITYVDVSIDWTAATLSLIIVQILEEYDCISKLIAQTYDGVAVLSSDIRGVEALIKEKCPQALYVWCSAYVLNLTMTRSFQCIADTKHFFSIIKSIVNFFHGKTKLLAYYNQFVDMKEISRVAETCWSFHSQIVKVVLSEKNNLIDLFEEMQENVDDIWDGDTLREVTALLLHFKEFEFNFFLKIFSDIFVQSGNLHEIIQTKTSDIGYCLIEIREFESFMTNYSNKFEVNYNEALEVTGPPKRKRNIDDPKMHYKRVFFEIIDNVLRECHHRYSNIKELKFLELLSNENFLKNSMTLPENVLSDLVNTYEGQFDIDRLKNELRCIYKSPEFKHDNAYSIIQSLHNNNLHSMFPQVLRLAKLITTFPIGSVSMDRSFSCLKQIRNYLQNTQGQERLTDLSLISIEKELLSDIKCSSTFYDNVLQYYLEKNRCIDLIYK